MIEQRIAALARCDVFAGRANESEIIFKALGPYPTADPDKALAWGEGAHMIATYRHR